MWVMNTLEVCAVLVSAFYGVLLAARKGMDVVGVFAVAFAVAFGGGTTRDLFLGRHPLFWIEKPSYPVIVFAVALSAPLLVRLLARMENRLYIPDAVGMALFTVVGTRIAVEAGTTPFVAALLGAITGTFGGVIGDVFCNEVPTLFRPAPLCASTAFAGAWVYLLLLYVDVLPDVVPPLVGAGVVVLMRIGAVRYEIGFKPILKN